MIEKLTNGQRSYLRKLAHPLKPTVQVGQQGLTEQVVNKVEQELAAHELIKIKYLDHKDQKHDLTDAIAEQTKSAVVMLVGNVAVLYREHADPERREIMLPPRGSTE